LGKHISSECNAILDCIRNALLGGTTEVKKKSDENDIIREKKIGRL